jgi:hypothetical protein
MWSLGHHLVGSNWLTVWMWPPDSLGQSWLHSVGQMLSRWPY